MFGSIYIVLYFRGFVNEVQDFYTLATYDGMEIIMKTERNILIAFILNFSFAVFEFIGGIFTGSIAILSDAVHDVGDAASIGASYFLERKSKRGADAKNTYGYARYSVLGGLITNLILLLGSCIVIYNAILRIIDPTPINYDGMILFAIFGVLVNFAAVFFTRGEGSLNQRAVSLHMLEDVLGWVTVLIGAIVMRFTSFVLLDPIMSTGVAVFILISAIRGLCTALNVFLEKVPEGVDVGEIREHVLEIDGVADVHHIHIWTLDGESHYSTMHIVTNEDAHIVKEKVREELSEHGVVHATLELEKSGEHCPETECHPEINSHGVHHHHHHH